MLKRTARPFYGDRQSRMHRHADAVMRVPLAYGETMKDREEAAKSIRADADLDMQRRKDAHAGRDGRAPHRGKAGIPIVHTGKAARKRERVACAAAIRKAHEPKATKRATKKAAKRLRTRTASKYGARRADAVVRAAQVQP